jgi:hypothetical protein
MKYEFRIIKWDTHFMLIPTIAIVREENGGIGISLVWFNRAIEFIVG